MTRCQEALVYSLVVHYMVRFGRPATKKKPALGKPSHEKGTLIFPCVNLFRFYGGGAGPIGLCILAKTLANSCSEQRVLRYDQGAIILICGHGFRRSAFLLLRNDIKIQISYTRTEQKHVSAMLLCQNCFPGRWARPEATNGISSKLMQLGKPFPLSSRQSA